MAFARQVTLRAGPLPDAHEIAQYEAALPGAADRIFTMAENQAAHRQTLERRVITWNLVGERFGQLVGAAIALFGIYIGRELVLAGKDAQGMAAILGPIGGMVWVFVIGKRKRDRNLQGKEKER
jgi:uncharacterized membrane protein